MAKKSAVNPLMRITALRTEVALLREQNAFLEAQNAQLIAALGATNTTTFGYTVEPIICNRKKK